MRATEPQVEHPHLAPGRPSGIRLCLATPTYHPFFSGAAERFRRYLPEFQARGVNVSVFTATPTVNNGLVASLTEDWASLPLGTRLPVELGGSTAVHRVRIPEFPGLRRAAWFAHSLAEFCREQENRPDVVQIFHPALAGMAGLWRLRRMGISIVAARTMMPSRPFGLIKGPLRRLSTRLAYAPVSCGVVSSTPMLRAVRRMGVRKRIEIIPHGVDTSTFRPARDAEERRRLRTTLGIHQDSQVLLFVGSIKRRKGLHRLLEAWCHLATRHADLQLVLAGPGWDPDEAEDPAYLNTLRRLAARSGAQERLHFLGRVTNVEEVMRVADVFIFPSSREGMPNAVAEAMATGLPVVTCPFEGLSSEFGSPGIHYIRTEFDPRMISDAITKLLSDSGGRYELGLRARAWADSQLTWTRTLDRYVKLYFEHSTMGRNGPNHNGGKLKADAIRE